MFPLITIGALLLSTVTPTFADQEACPVSLQLGQQADCVTTIWANGAWQTAPATSPTTSAFPTPIPVPKIGDYEHYGCFSDMDTSGHDMHGVTVVLTETLGHPRGMLSDERMDIAMCKAHCHDQTYFGITNGNQCFCGSVLQEKDHRVNETECNIPCPGSGKGTPDLNVQLTVCGGHGTMTVYRHTNYLWRPTSPTQQNWTSRTWKNLTWTVSATTAIMLFIFYKSCGSWTC